MPFGELCRLLAFGITVDPVKGKAEGFFIQEKRRFTLDLATLSVRSDGKVFTINPSQVVRRPREILVDARLLEVWFPLEVKVNLKLSSLILKPKEKLPIQEQWEREGKYLGGGGLASSHGVDDQAVGEFVKTQYSLADMPFVDVAAYWSKSRGSFAGQPAVSASLSGDLLWMSSSIRVSRDQRGHFVDTSWTLFREDPHAELLGPLHAKRIEIGNILEPPTLGAVGALPEGRGVLVDNYPLSYRSKFATRTFTGALEEGWSVELYQNSGLIGFQKSKADGRYEFRDVPLRYGLNQFRLVFHGPFGQTRTESARIDIASSQPAPGELFYRVAGLRPLGSTFTSDDVDPAILETTRNRIASLVQGEYGLSRVFSVGFGAASVGHLDGLLHRYEDVGLRGVFPYLSVQVDAARDQAPGLPVGSGRKISLSTGYSYSTLTIERSDYQDGFRPLEYIAATDSSKILERETRIAWDSLVTWRGRPISLSLSRDQRGYVDSSWTATDSARATFSRGIWTITPTLNRVTGSSGGEAAYDSSVFITGSTKRYSIQSEINASRTSSNGTKLTGWSFQADSVPVNGYSHRLGVRGTDATFENTTFIAGLSKLTGRYGYGIEAQASRSVGYSINLRLQASLGREPRTRTWVQNAMSMAGQGAISAVAFLDSNGNGKLDPNERVLRETRFWVGNQASENAISDPRVFFKTGVARNQETLVRVDETSLEDPAYSSLIKGYRILPRPGKVACLDFPIAIFGEINGTTCIRKGVGTAEFGGLEIELLKADGQRFRMIRSAYDGYFELRELPLGDYLLRVSPAEVTRLKLKEMPPRKFHLDASKNLYEGQYITVESIVPPTAVPEPSLRQVDPSPSASAHQGKPDARKTPEEPSPASSGQTPPVRP